MSDPARPIPSLRRRSSISRSVVLTIGLLALVAILLDTGLMVGIQSTTGSSPTPTSTAPGSDPASSTQKLAFPGSGAVGFLVSPAVHDLSVTSSNLTTLVGDPALFSATLSGGAAVYDWWWGDGSNSTSSLGQLSHSYSAAGIYLVYVAANNSSGVWHDNLDSLLRFVVQESFSPDERGNLVQLGGNVVANTTNKTSANAIAAPGGFIQVSNWIMEQPTNPQWKVLTPSYSFLAPLGTANLSSPIVSNISLSAVTVAFSPNATVGLYPLTFSVPTANIQGAANSTARSNFTFTLVVTPGAGIRIPPLQNSPHKGILDVYDYIGNGSSSWIGSPSFGYGPIDSLDPAITHNVNSEGLLEQVYQTLISYNGSQTGLGPNNFVPNLATCVPGSQECQAMYGTTLADPPYYTFVIDPNASFYNFTTGVASEVQPNDVAFSIVRNCVTLSRTDPGQGRDVCQSLLPGWFGGIPHQANASWDGGLHYGLNNTPSNLLSAVLVNDSSFCNATMMDHIHGAGCVTFNTSAASEFSPVAFPLFLDYLATPAQAISSCSYVTEMGFGLPGWMSGSRCSGSPPSPAPDNTAWDSYILNVSKPQGGVNWTSLQFAPLGSGPYFLRSFTPGVPPTYPFVNAQNYTLSANPFWGGTTCQGGLRNGCLPPAFSTSPTPTYATTVNVHLETSEATVRSAVANGTTDLSELGPDGASFLLSGVQHGILGVAQAPTDSTSFYALSLNYSLSLARNILGTTPTLPSGALRDYNFRQFLNLAYPHRSAQAQTCALAGTEYCFQYGGMIPSFDTGYTPTNLTWPVTDPGLDSRVNGSAAWWWSRTANDTFVGASCTAVRPCTFPLAVPSNLSTTYDAALLWADSLRSISNNAIQPTVVNLSGCFICVTQPNNSSLSAVPIAWYVWTPDFLDPQYENVLTPDGNWFAEGTFYSIIQNDSAACAGGAINPIVTQQCQGWALLDADQSQFQGPGGMARALLYNIQDHIAANLSLYVPAAQLTQVTSFAPWIDPTSIDLNPELTSLGLTGQPFYDLQYQTSIPQGYPLTGGSVSSAFGLARTVGPVIRLAIGSGATNPTIQLVISSAGGSGIYNYSWVGLPAGCSSMNAPVVYCTPSAPVTTTPSASVTSGRLDVGQTVSFSSSPGNYRVYANITDSDGRTAASPVTPVSVTNTGGGRASTYTWTESSPNFGCSSSSTSSSIPCTPTVGGTYAVSVVAVNANGGQSATETSAGFTVYALPVTVAPNPNRTSANVGQIIIFSTTTTLGAPGPVSYAWAQSSSGLGCDLTSTAASIACLPTVTGTYSVSVYAVDTNGGHSTSVTSAGVTVKAPPTTTPPQPSGSRTPTGFLGLPGNLGYVLIGGVGAAAVGVVLAVYRFRGGGDGARPANRPGPYARYQDARATSESEPVVTLSEGESDPAEDLY